MAKKIKVAVIFGGRSAEHEVSLQSAKNVIDAIDKSKFDVSLIGITKEGKWVSLPTTNYLLNAEDPKTVGLIESKNQLALSPGNEFNSFLDLNKTGASLSFDVAFPVLHGTFGEDGTIQGLFKLAGIPFVGAGVLGSAVGMDKDVMKRLLRDAGLPIGKFICLKRSEKAPSYEEAVKLVGQPFFVKPSNAGSSVGVHKVKDAASFKTALQDAFLYDTKILIEEALIGREIEVAVLGNDEPRASVPGELIVNHEFYSYEAKYIDPNGAVPQIPAKLSPEMVSKIQALAIKTFKALDCSGMGRVDFFVKHSGEIFVNEINTIPGFTKISMYPKMWEATGLSYTNLITKLIELALEKHEQETAKKLTF